MIIVTRLNNSRFAVNPDLIERIHSNPDTTIVLVDGTTYIVTETMEEVIDLIAAYRAKVIVIARSAAPVEPRRGMTGEVVPILAADRTDAVSQLRRPPGTR